MFCDTRFVFPPCFPSLSQGKSVQYACQKSFLHGHLCSRRFPTVPAFAATVFPQSTARLVATAKKKTNMGCAHDFLTCDTTPEQFNQNTKRRNSNIRKGRSPFRSKDFKLFLSPQNAKPRNVKDMWGNTESNLAGTTVCMACLSHVRTLNCDGFIPWLNSRISGLQRTTEGQKDLLLFLLSKTLVFLKSLSHRRVRNFRPQKKNQ